MGNYVEQKPHHINYYFTKDNIDYKLFNILMNKRTKIMGLDVSASIVGESHIIELEIDGKKFNEVFACVDIDDSQQILKRIDEDRDSYIEYDLKDNLLYSFMKEYHEFTEENLSEFKSTKDKEDLFIELDYKFPKESEDSDTPETIIYIYENKEEKNITIKTLHSYPNENCIIISKSIIKKIDEEANKNE